MPHWWLRCRTSRRCQRFLSPVCGCIPCRAPVSGQAWAWWLPVRCCAGRPHAANKGLFIGGHERTIFLEDLQKVLHAAESQALFVVVAHSVFHFIAFEAQLIGADHHFVIAEQQGVFMTNQFPLALAAFDIRYR